MSKNGRRITFVAAVLAVHLFTTANASDSSWQDVVANYQIWRALYSIMVPPLGVSLDEIESDISSGSYAFTSESDYYWDLTGSDYFVDPTGEIAQTVTDGTWVYFIEDLASAQVYVMRQGETAALASLASDPWPSYDPGYEGILINELAKRRVVWWLKIRVVEESESETSPSPETQEEEEAGGDAMTMESGEETNCPCLLDLDGDGVPNRTEMIAGTNPQDSNDFPRILNYDRSPANNMLMLMTWSGVTNRQYGVEYLRGIDALVGSPSWNVLTQGLDGADAEIVFSEDVSDESLTNGFYRLGISETDINTNGLPDWWEIQQYGGLTNLNAYGDEDGDGVENQEEYWLGYSPNISDRTVYHSMFHSVTVNDNDPDGEDDDTELFDFHGGGRTLSLASNALGNGFGSLNGEGKFSTGIYFNNDTSNLYIGISGVQVAGANAFVMFLDTDSAGVTNLRHLTQTTPPFGLSQFRNLDFDATNFTPNVGLILGGRYGDGQNYDNYSFTSTSATNNIGQGVYLLSDGSDFPGFTDTGPSKISQWARGYDGDTISAQAGIEIAISLADLNLAPGYSMKVAAMFVGGTNSSNQRYVSGEVYGKRVAGTLDGDNYGFNSTMVLGAEVYLTGPENGLQSCSYPGFTDDDVLFQGFYWNVDPPGTWWTNLAGKVADLAQSGFTMIWLPPPYKSANAGYSVGYDPFDHYDLGEYDQRGSIRTLYGFKSNLTEAMSTMLASNMTPICDIVLNHMAGGTGTAYKSYSYPHGTFQKGVTDFHPSTEGHNDEVAPYHDNWGFGTYTPLDVYGLDNAFLTPNMRLGFKKWGNWLVVSNNFQAFRFDFTEAVEPWFVWEWMNYPGQRQRFAFMEYWKNASGKQMQEWLDLTGHSAAIYDWTLQTNLEAMCEEAGSFDMNLLKAPSLLGLEPSYTVTFIENHDTLQPDGTNTPPDHRGVSRQKELAYAYIMHSKGLPMVFYRDYYLEPYYNYLADTNSGAPLKPKIDRLILIRKKTVAGDVHYLSTNADVFVQQRDGGGVKPGSILIINDDESSTLNISIQTMYATNTVLMDLVATNSPNSVTTDVSGVVTLSCPNRDYRIYGVTNALE